MRLEQHQYIVLCGIGGWKDLHILKERKVTRVMGCALSRQLSVPGAGLSMFAIAIEVLLSSEDCYERAIVVILREKLSDRLPNFLRPGLQEGLTFHWTRCKSYAKSGGTAPTRDGARLWTDFSIFTTSSTHV